jgi:hypothetical protein
MNEIIKKLEIPGHETSVIIVPRKSKSAKAVEVADGIQLSLDIELKPTKQVIEK